MSLDPSPVDVIRLAVSICQVIDRSGIPDVDAGSCLLGIAVQKLRLAGLSDADVRAVVQHCLNQRVEVVEVTNAAYSGKGGVQ